MKRLKQLDYFYIIVFLIPFFLQVVFYAVGGYYPFGDKTVLTWDLNHQYTSFFSWMNRVLKHESIDTIWYSFSVSLGGATIGLMGYYLLSPFNLLLLPFSTEWLPVGIQLIIMLKLSCSGVTMYYYLKKRFGICNYGTVLFAVMYALMGYNIVYQQNIMWLDGVILLPLILINIYKMVTCRRWTLYPVWIAMAIVTDFYIAYMVILFAFIYFLLEYSVSDQVKKFRMFLHRLLQFMRGTFWGVGLSCVVFLPVIYEVFGIGRGSADGVLESILSIAKLDSKLWMLPLKELVGAYDQQQLVSGLPNIYVSLLCIPFLVLFFADTRNPQRIRLGWGLAIIIIFLSFASIGLNQIWQGFTYASGCNYRYSFCMSFLCITTGYQQYLRIRETGKLCQFPKRREQAFTWMILDGLCLLIWIASVVWIQYEEQVYEFSSIYKWSCTALFLICGILGMRNLRRGRINLFYTVASLAMCVELVLNMYWCAEGFGYQELHEYQEYVTSVEDVYQELINENGGSFFRIESELREPLDDAMLLGYPSITHYSSILRDEVAQYALENDILADGFGRQATLFRDYNISTEQLGRYAVKYLLTDRLPQDGNMDGWVIRQENPFYVLENTDFKPLCYLATGDTVPVEIEMKDSAHIVVKTPKFMEPVNEMLTSIPDREGWMVTVDGKKVETQDEDLFIRIVLPEEEHEIIMTYHQPMLAVGAGISLTSLLLYMVSVSLRRRSA